MSDIAVTSESPSRSPLSDEVARRRTFAIISHPDAGKTTLTEKLLLFGGAINLAGQVKAKGERRNTRSDWMKIERERGISVVTSVMTFEFEGLVFNLLDMGVASTVGNCQIALDCARFPCQTLDSCPTLPFQPNRRPARRLQMKWRGGGPLPSFRTRTPARPR